MALATELERLRAEQFLSGSRIVKVLSSERNIRRRWDSSFMFKFFKKIITFPIDDRIFATFCRFEIYGSKYKINKSPIPWSLSRLFFGFYGTKMPTKQYTNSSQMST